MRADEFATKIIGQLIEVTSAEGVEKQTVIGSFIPGPKSLNHGMICIQFAVPLQGCRKFFLKVPQETDLMSFICGHIALTTTLDPRDPPATFLVVRR